MNAGRDSVSACRSPSLRAGVALALATALRLPASAAELPQPCTAGACAGGPSTLVSSGSAGAVVVGNTLRVDQQSQNAVLNWRSFNVGVDGTVQFRQPAETSVALNRIFQQDPSRILGSISANGQVYLVNTNGIVFGPGAKVDVGGMVASSLDITRQALENGIARAVQSGAPAFAAARDAAGASVSGAVTIERGARLTADGGQVLVFAPEVNNRGVIRTPDGQTVLAAGESVYLAASGDPNLRGLLVQVEAGGTVVNGVEGNRNVANPEELVGQILSERGNVTLAGLAVRQLGRVSATTSVRSNGTVRLQAHDGIEILPAAGGGFTLNGTRGGELTVGERAVNEVRLQPDDDAKQVDVNAQPRSSIRMQGRTVVLREDSRTVATGGDVVIEAQPDPRTDVGLFDPAPDASRIYVAPRASIDVAGAAVELPMERNVLRVELRGSQLADSPLQRDGPLRGQTVYVDVRRTGTRPDGSTWVGTPLADLRGDVAGIERDVAERNLAGGSIRLQSQGAVLVDPSAVLDVSGGSIRYLDGYVDTSVLLSAGRPVDIAVADPERRYEGVATSYVVTDPRWGVTRSFPGFARDAQGQFQRGYVEGKDAGSLSIVAPAIALDAQLRGGTVRGPLQRRPAGTVPAGSLYRSVSEVPLGAELRIGAPGGNTATPNYVVGDIRFEERRVLPGLANADGTLFDPLRDEALPELLLEAVRLRPSLLGGGAVSRLTVRGNGELSLPEELALRVPAGGVVDLGAARVSVGGDIDAPSGTINLRAEPTSTLGLGGTVFLDVLDTSELLARGGWVNDLEAVAGGELAPLFTSGGRVTLAARQGALRLVAGSLVDVTGGAVLDAAGRLAPGTGGNVSIGNTPATEFAVPSPIEVGGTIRGHSVGRGGRLSLTAGSICIGADGCAGTEVDDLVVDAGLLQGAGFGEYSLNSNRGGLQVAPGTELVLRQVSLEVDATAGLQPTGTDLRTFAGLQVREATRRRPVGITLSAAPNPGSSGYTEDTFDDAPGLVIGAGAIIDTDPGARIALNSSSWMVVEGGLSAPSGSIDLRLNGDLPVAQFLSAQGIWLGASSVLAAPGAATVVADDRGTRSGTVLDGGAISIRADRGYVVALPGSRVEAPGTAATLDLRSTPGSTVTAPVTVASSGGSISISAAEGVFLNGDLHAAAGAWAGAAGGRLSLTLDTGTRVDPGNPVSLFPTGERVLRLSQESTSVIVAPRSRVPTALNGLGLLDARSVAEGGFGSLSLRAADVYGRRAGPLELLANGRVQGDGDARFALGQRLQVDAARIGGGDGVLQLVAPYVTLANTSRLAQAPPAALATGDAALEVEADLIDLVGSIAFEGIGRASLEARGDIRVTGVQLAGGRRLDGSLHSSGDLTLAAAQLYPTTLSRYALTVLGEDGSLRLLPGGARGAVYSAGGDLLLSASRIENGGVIAAPLGSVTLRGDLVELLPGGEVTTSAAGTTLPFGETQAGFDWSYSLLDQQVLVVGFDGFSLPQQRVLLDARDIRLDEGGRIDISGGGDLLAYEWIPGVGGTRDLLSARERPDQFAILPGSRPSSAPLDASWGRDSPLLPGDAVHLAGVSGVPDGTYALLPARYALLPGAYLVSAVDGFRDIVPGESHRLPDGSTVVAGYRTILGTGARDSRYGGFAVRPGEAILAEAEYVTSRATEFFGERREAAARLPADAGLLSLSAREQLLLGSSLVSQAAAGARGAGVDIAALRPRIAAPGAVAEADELLLDAAALQRLAAESLVVGGRRTAVGADLGVEVNAERVVVDPGVTLGRPELLLVARESIDVGEGAVLEASGPALPGDSGGTTRVLLDGDGALLRVSSGAQVVVERSGGDGSRGSVSIGTAAAIRATRGGSVTVDATRDSTSRGDITVPEGSLSLGSSRISLGDAPESTPGLVLRGGQLASVGASELVLRSASTIDLYGAAELSVQDLTLEAAALRAVGPGVAAGLRAGRVLRLENPRPDAGEAAAPGTGSLVANADRIELGAGSVVLDGFADARLVAARDIVSVASGSVDASGSLELVAARLTTLGGVERRIAAGGTLLVTGAGVASPPTTDGIDRLGGVLELEASRITHSGAIWLPSGRVQMTATGAAPDDHLRLADGASIDLAGLVVDFDGVALATPGGSLRLEAHSGDVALSSGATVDVSAAAGGEAGRVVALAPSGALELAGTLRGAVASGSGGSFLGDARRLVDFEGLNARLDAGGFDRLRDLRQRGEGSLVLGGAGSIRARDLRITADGGGVTLDGIVDARGDDGGRIEVNARDTVAIGGRLLASARTADGSGGRVLLNATSDTAGSVRVAGGAIIDVSRGGEADVEATGTVGLRLARSRLVPVSGAVAGVDLAGRIVGTERVLVEGVQRYLDTDGVIGASEVTAVAGNTRFADAQRFMATAPAVASAIGPLATIRPGIEIGASGDLVLAADWNLAGWRFAGAPGMLTLRAGGDLRIDRSLSDGMPDPSSFVLPTVPGESWSYRLVAGADASSPDTLAVLAPGRLAPGRGSFSIAPGDFISTDPFTVTDFRMVRTGTGDITIRAGRDVTLGNQASVIYAAGVRGPGIVIPDEFEGLNGLPYPTGGGDIDIAAGGSVLGTTSTQLFTDWMWRVGAPGSAPTAWTVNFERFEQGVLSAGGDVRVSAGANVENLAVSLPAIGRQVGGLRPGENRVEVAGGGSLTVSAGRSVLGGVYLVGNGHGSIVAGDRIGTASARQDPNLRPLDTVLGSMGLAHLTLRARDEVRVEAVVNPTLIPQGVAQGAFDRPTYFASYDPASSVSVTSVAGDVVMNSNTGLVVRAFPSLAAQVRDDVSLRVLPPSLRLGSMSRDVQLLGPLALFPAPRGNLEVFAARDVTGASTDAVHILLSDADPDYLPSIARPQGTLARVVEVLATPLTSSPNFHAAIPVHADSRQPDGLPDAVPVRIVARDGDIRLSPERIDDTSGFYLAKRGRFIAGGSVQDLSFNTQHLRVDDVTTVEAGGDIRYRLGRNTAGGVTETRREIVVDGPGRLELIAGGDVNLQTSGGIASRGNLRVASLPDGGASVSVLAGLRGRVPQYAAFTAKYLVEGDRYDQPLVDFVSAITGAPVADRDEALEVFAALPESQRAAFIERVYLAELRSSGRFAATSGNADYSAAFEAIETLFPGANPDLDGGEANAYDGDVLMYFSRIYTLDGGDIALLVPGGEINVGLATPPAAFGLQKTPSQLGLVVQSTGSVGAFSFADFSVNESRVFAADGGDILVWSTRGDIDAGRGAKTAISAPPPVITFDPNGNPQVTFPAALTGSGIQTVATSQGREPGDVDLYAPRGIVNAGDAGIVAGNLTIGATAVLGADNIQVTGISVGVPVDAGGLGAALSGVSSVGSSASQAASEAVTGGGAAAGAADGGDSEGSAALSWLEVFVIGLGDEQCDPKDVECLRRQTTGRQP